MGLTKEKSRNWKHYNSRTLVGCKDNLIVIGVYSPSGGEKEQELWMEDNMNLVEQLKAEGILKQIWLGD